MEKINQVGASFIRTDFDWSSIQSEGENGYTFEHIDQMMSSVKNKGMNVLGIVSVPQNEQRLNWADYVSATSEWYKHDVKYWEFINEAGLKRNQISGFTAENYVELLKRGYKIIKNYNEHAKILYSGVSDIELGFIDVTMCLGANKYFDIMNIHIYTYKPETLFDYYEDLSRCLSKYGRLSPPYG